MSEDCKVCGMSYEDVDHTECETDDDYNNTMKMNSDIIEKVKKVIPKGVVTGYSIMPLGVTLKKGSDIIAIRNLVKTVYKGSFTIEIQEFGPIQYQ